MSRCSAPCGSRRRRWTCRCSVLLILIAIAANALGRLTLAALAGPARFWLPLAGISAAAATAATTAWLALG